MLSIQSLADEQNAIELQDSKPNKYSALCYN